MEERLPSHRQLFAALIPPSPLPAAGEFAGTAAAAAEAIADRPSFAQHSNWRRQLLTLHVIFPSLLLPALDLLDRGLVSRLVVTDGQQKAAETAVATSSSHAVVAADTESTDEESPSRASNSGQEPELADQICIYTVQSAASPTSRRKRPAQPRAKTYAVHLDAWNCSCGGFALDAYSRFDTRNKEEPPSRSSAASALRFGGLELASADDFPCCKHLLACVLAETWRKMPASRARDRYTTKEELAAIIGGA